MSKTENTNTETKQQETTNSKIDISAIDYDALACVIMDAYESDRAESGRKEIVKGMKYTLQKYQTAHDREIIDDMLMNFTGYTLETLVFSFTTYSGERTYSRLGTPDVDRTTTSFPVHSHLIT